MLVDLMLSESLIGFSAVVADATVVGSGNVFGLNVAPTVGLVTKVLDAGDARPDPVNLHHVLHQGVSVT